MRRVAARALLAAILGLGFAPPASTQLGAADGTVRFAAVDVIIDSREPLAAWQFELGERRGIMTVVGVENGEAEAFPGAPHYDLEAVRRGAADRIVIADYSLSSAARLPVGETRVATVHVRLAGAEAPDYALRLVAAGDAEGRPIEAAIRLNSQPGRSEQ